MFLALCGAAAWRSRRGIYEFAYFSFHEGGVRNNVEINGAGRVRNLLGFASPTRRTGAGKCN